MKNAGAEAAEYWLQIVFKSNERPWRNDRYEPYPRLGMSRAQAIEWAAFFHDNIGGQYQITLFENGTALPYESACESPRDVPLRCAEST
jgi:hypothetical protein